MLSVVGAGLKCPPEQSAERKQLVSVMKTVILLVAETECKIQLSYGRAQRPAPTGLYGFFFAFRSRKSVQSFGFHKNFLRRF